MRNPSRRGVTVGPANARRDPAHTRSRTYQCATGDAPTVWDRVVERRRAVALARHFREAEGLSVVEIAERLGRSATTIKAYFYDPS